jgi:hypothetical protein
LGPKNFPALFLLVLPLKALKVGHKSWEPFLQYHLKPKFLIETFHHTITKKIFATNRPFTQV